MKKQKLSSKVETIKTKSYVVDLNVHTPMALGSSLVQGLDSAPAVVRLSKVKGLDMIAVTDFYTGASIDRVTFAAEGAELSVVPGFSFRCIVGQCDDVTMTALFPEGLGSKGIEDILRLLDVPLSAANKISYIMVMPLHEIVSIIESKGGVIIPCRMDKTPAKMGIIPTLVEQYGFRTFDLAYSDSVALFKTRWPKIKFALVNFSSATALAQIGNRSSTVKLSQPGFAGLREIASRAEVSSN